MLVVATSRCTVVTCVAAEQQAVFPDRSLALNLRYGRDRIFERQVELLL